MKFANPQIIITCAFVIFFSFSGKNLISQTEYDNINSYAEKCNYYWRVNLDSAIIFGHKAVDLAKKETELSDDISRAYMFLGVAYYYLGDYDSASAYVTEGLYIAEEINSEWGQGFGNNLLTILMRRKADYPKAIEYANKTIEIRKNAGDTVNLAGAYNNLATTYNYMGDLDMALKYMLMSLELNIKINDTIGMVRGHGNISDMYLKMENIDLAKKHIDKAIEITSPGTPEFADHYLILGNIFHTYYNQPDTALKVYQTALSIFEQIGIDDGVAVASENIGCTLQDLGKYDEALFYLRKAKTIYCKIDDLSQIAHINMSIGEYYRKLNNYDSASFYLNNALSLARKINQSKVIKETLGSLYLLNKQFDLNKQGLEYMEQYKNYSDSLNTKQAYDRMAMLEARYKTAEKEKMIIRYRYEQEKEKRHKQLLYGTIFFVIMMMIVISITMFIRYKKQQEISEQRQQLLINKKKLVETELEKQKIKENEMKIDLEHKARQLSTHALHMMQKSKMLQEVKEKLEETIKKVDEKCKPDLKQIIRLIVHNLKTEKEWELFKMYFEQVNNNFYTNLKKHNSDLSQTDIRMCSLIKLGLNLKETASVLNVAPNTVKNARYRVKQKLGLGNDDSLSGFINSI